MFTLSRPGCDPVPREANDKLSAIKKKAMMIGSPWPNKKAMGFSAHGL
jgi:hypothetical protein